MGKVAPEISLELTFEGLVLGRSQQYILRRTYKLNPSDKPVESVMLNMNGTQFVYGTAMPLAQRAESEQQVNKIIKANLPQELSKYFLFDAMRSSELLKENVFYPKLAGNIANEVHDVIRQKETLKQEREGILTDEQLKEVTEKILAYMKAKLLCPHWQY